MKMSFVKLMMPAVAVLLLLAMSAETKPSCESQLKHESKLENAPFKLSISSTSKKDTKEDNPIYKVNIESTNKGQLFTYAELTTFSNGKCGVGSFLYNNMTSVYGRRGNQNTCPKLSLLLNPMTELSEPLLWIPPHCGCVQFRAAVVSSNAGVYTDSQSSVNDVLTRTVCVERKVSRDKFTKALCKAQRRIDYKDVVTQTSFIERHNLEPSTHTDMLVDVVKDRMDRVNYCCKKTKGRSIQRCLHRVRFQRIDAMCQKGRPDLVFTSLRSDHMKSRERKCCFILGSHRYSCFHHKSKLPTTTAGLGLFDYSLDEFDPLNDLADFASVEDNDIVRLVTSANRKVVLGKTFEKSELPHPQKLISWGSLTVPEVNKNADDPKVNRESFIQSIGEGSITLTKKQLWEFVKMAQEGKSILTTHPTVNEKKSKIANRKKGYKMSDKQTEVTISGRPKVGSKRADLKRIASGMNERTPEEDEKALKKWKRKLTRDVECCGRGVTAGRLVAQKYTHINFDEVLSDCVYYNRILVQDHCLDHDEFVKCCADQIQSVRTTSTEYRDHLRKVTGSSKGIDLYKYNPNRYAADEVEDEEGEALDMAGGRVGKQKEHAQMDREEEERYKSMRKQDNLENDNDDDEENGPQKLDKVDMRSDKDLDLLRRDVGRGAIGKPDKDDGLKKRKEIADEFDIFRRLPPLDRNSFMNKVSNNANVLKQERGNTATEDIEESDERTFVGADDNEELDDDIATFPRNKVKKQSSRGNISRTRPRWSRERSRQISEEFDYLGESRLTELSNLRKMVTKELRNSKQRSSRRSSKEKKRKGSRKRSSRRRNSGRSSRRRRNSRPVPAKFLRNLRPQTLMETTNWKTALDSREMRRSHNFPTHTLDSKEQRMLRQEFRQRRRNKRN